VPYRFGLFSAVDFEAIGTHDRVGMTWRSDGCAVADITLDACKNPAIDPLDSSLCGYSGTAEAFTAYILDTDSLAGVSMADHEAQARARFIAAEQAAVEGHIFAELLVEGIAAGSIIDLSTQGAKGPADAYLSMLATVEDQLALLTGNEGVIYMSRFAAIALSDHTEKSNGMLRTRLGTPIAAMAVGATANTIRTGDVMFGTGPVKASRGEIEVFNGTGDLAINDASIIAQRTYAFGYDCGVVGAEITF
jgi:hypothetical protein